MKKLKLKDLIRITEEELNKPSVRKELNEFLDRVCPDDDYMSMEDLKVEEDLFRMCHQNGK